MIEDISEETQAKLKSCKFCKVKPIQFRRVCGRSHVKCKKDCHYKKFVICSSKNDVDKCVKQFATGQDTLKGAKENWNDKN